MGGRIFHQTHWAPLLRMQGSVSEVKLELMHGDGSSMPVVLNALRRDTARGVVHAASSRSWSRRPAGCTSWRATAPCSPSRWSAS
jgi:hypothetical protein